MRSKQLIQELVKVKLTDNQITALVSFIDSMGEDIFKNSSLLKSLNKNDFAAATAEFNRWVVKSGRRSAELAQLRQTETDLFNQ
jgi:lysozyme